MTVQALLAIGFAVALPMLVVRELLKARREMDPKKNPPKGPHFP